MLRYLVSIALLAASSIAAAVPAAPAPAGVPLRDQIKQSADAAKATTIRDGRILVAQVSLACGIAPIPPIGCKVGPCVCDQSGNNCQWTFICK